jgi:hypothetical protein
MGKPDGKLLQKLLDVGVLIAMCERDVLAGQLAVIGVDAAADDVALPACGLESALRYLKAIP